MKTINLHFDGSCLGNGTASAKAGYGLIVETNGDILKETFGKLRQGLQTHNRAELAGLLTAVQWLHVHGEAGVQYNLYCDNKALIDCVNGIGTRRNNRDLWDEIEKICDEINLLGYRVRAHHCNKALMDISNDTYIFNVRADELAFRGANALFI